MPTGVDLSAARPELVIIAAIVAMMVAPLVLGKSSYVSAFIAGLGAVAAGLVSIETMGMVDLGGQAFMSPSVASGMLVVDNVSLFFKAFIMLFLVLITGMWWIGSGGREKDAPEFFVLLLGSALGMCLMVSTLNLLMILIAIELASLPSYAIVGFAKGNRKGSEASLKYVIFGAVSAALMLYGISLLYGIFHSLEWQVIATGMSGVLASGGALSILVGIALFCLAVGIGFKISAVPFHFWCPDVFEGASIEVTTWLSVASKAAGLGLLLRIVQTLATATGSLEVLTPVAYGVGILAAITCTVGNLSAFRQNSVKRMLAYSSIAHAGYMMMLAAILMTTSPELANQGISALIAYVVVYMLMNLGAFGVVALVYWETGREDLEAFTGLGRRSLALAIPLTVFMFSLIGMPPLGGFIVKWWMLAALGAAAQGQSWLWMLVAVAAFNTLLSLFYYVRVLRQAFLADDGQPVIQPKLSGLAMVNVCAVLILLVGTVWANPLKRQADRFSTQMYTVAPADVEGAVTAQRAANSPVDGLADAGEGAR
jgi:NADH-quinone oxidoreductase subunit N